MPTENISDGTASVTKSGVKLTDAQRLDWLRLIRSENVGPRTFRSLLNHFGGAGAALNALPDLARRGGANRAIKVFPAADAQREIDEAQRRGVTFVALGEAEYPHRLSAIDDPPPLLAVRGNCADPGRTNGGDCRIAQRIRCRNKIRRTDGARTWRRRICHRVGSCPRHRCGRASRQRRQRHRRRARRRPRSYLSGRTCALLDAILARGAAISEMPLDWEPRARDFPRRNRLISGLALGVVIVEAAQRSGSLITARLALEQGREVFAVPGSPLDPRAEGTNNLIKQGATCTTSAADVIAVLQPILGQSVTAPMAEPESFVSADTRDRCGRSHADCQFAGADAGFDRRPDPAVGRIASCRSHNTAGTRPCRAAGTSARRPSRAPVRKIRLCDVNY